MTQGEALRAIAHAAAMHLALEARKSGNPDEGPTKNIRTAYRNLSSSGSGSEVYRRFIFPGETEPQWGDERLPASGVRARERRCEVCEDIPIGTVVLDYDKTVYKHRRGKASFTAGMLTAVGIQWLEHRVLRKVKAYEIALPDGSKLQTERR